MPAISTGRKHVPPHSTWDTVVLVVMSMRTANVESLRTSTRTQTAVLCELGMVAVLKGRNYQKNLQANETEGNESTAS